MTGFDYTSCEREADVLGLLLGWHPALTHRDELVAEIGDRVTVDDALAILRRHGLIHRCGPFVWASWTAMAAEEAVTA